MNAISLSYPDKGHAFSCVENGGLKFGHSNVNP